VLDILEEILGLPREQIRPDSNFLRDLDAVDLESVEIAYAIEEEFDLYVSDSAAENIKTVEDLCQWVGPRLREAPEKEAAWRSKKPKRRPNQKLRLVIHGLILLGLGTISAIILIVLGQPPEDQTIAQRRFLEWLIEEENLQATDLDLVVSCESNADNLAMAKWFTDVEFGDWKLAYQRSFDPPPSGRRRRVITIKEVELHSFSRFEIDYSDWYSPAGGTEYEAKFRIKGKRAILRSKEPISNLGR